MLDSQRHISIRMSYNNNSDNNSDNIKMIITDEFQNAVDLGKACRDLITEMSKAVIEDTASMEGLMTDDIAHRVKMFKLDPFAKPFDLMPPPSYEESQLNVMNLGEGDNHETVHDILNKALLSRRKNERYRRLTCISWLTYRCWLAYILWEPSTDSYWRMKEWFEALSNDEQVDEYELLLEEVEMLRPGGTL